MYKRQVLDIGKRILIISDATLEGGTNTYIYDLLSVVKKNSDYEVSLLLDNNDSMVKMVERCRGLGVYVYSESIYHAKNQDKQIYQKVKNIVSIVMPDIVHVFCASIRACITIREIILKLGIPLFSTETYLPKTYPITELDLERVRNIYEHTKCVTTVCNDSIEVLRNNYGIRTRNIICIPTSIDVAKRKFYKRTDQDKIRAIIVARLVKQKGVDLLIEAFKCLDDMVKERYTISIYGEGEDSCTLQRLVCEYGLEKYIQFWGWQKEFIHKLKDYNLGIIPSRDEGGLPYVILELLSSGLPCIASDVSGISEVTNHGKYAELFELESIDDLKEKLIEFASNPQKLQNKISNVRGYLMENYDKETNYKQFLKLWTKYL